MKNNSLNMRKIMMFGITALIVLGIIAIVSFFMVYKNILDTSKVQDIEDIPKITLKTKAYETHSEPNLPFCYQPVYDQSGTEISLKQYKGKTLIILFWTGWCPHCQTTMQDLPAISDMIKKYNKDTPVEFALVHRSEEKESPEQAQNILMQAGIDLTSYYDHDRKFYNSLKLESVPSLLVIDSYGVLRAKLNNTEIKVSQVEQQLKFALLAQSANTEKFVSQYMAKSGGYYTNYNNKKTSTPGGYDILSESQGMIMLHAVNSNDEELFNNAYQFAKNNLFYKNLYMWVLEQQGELAKTNATIDDLRIYRALHEASKKIENYEESADDLAKNLYKYCVKQERLVDFFDFEYAQQADTLSLCYADFETLEILSKNDKRFKTVYNNAYDVVAKGYISDRFPLYYPAYSYNDKSYLQKEINTAEAMITILNLSKIGRVKQQSIDWIYQRLQQGDLASRYTVDGKPIDGYLYESTAVNAIIFQIARTINDKALADLAFSKMEKHRVIKQGSIFNGAFGEQKNNTFYSFDQISAILAYDSVLQ